MRYAYHFEFCERPEMPEWLRGDLFLSLAWVQKKFGLQAILISTLPKILKSLNPTKLIELGAGSGDSLAELAKVSDLSMLATDKYPQLDLWEKKLEGFKNVDWSEEQIGFEDFTVTLKRELVTGSVLMLTSAFHHIADRDAADFLEKAANAGCHVLIVEPLPRTLVGVLLGALTGAPALLFPLWAPEVSLWRKLRIVALHWFFPLIPFILSHDGIVSALRQRTRADWVRLTQGLKFEPVVQEGLGIFSNFAVTLLKCH